MELSAEQQRALVEPGHAELSVRRQCELLGLNRSTLYYEPAAETEENLALMRLLDEEYTRHPFKGSRRMALWLSEQTGREVNRKRVQRLMGLMGLEAIYPRPKLSLPGQGKKVEVLQQVGRDTRTLEEDRQSACGNDQLPFVNHLEHDCL